MPNNNDFTTSAITFIGPFNTQTAMSISMFPFSNDNYDDLVFDGPGGVYVIYGGSSFSTLPSSLSTASLNGEIGFQTTGTVGGTYYGSNLCGVKNFLGDDRNAMVLGHRTNAVSYVVLYKPTIGATLDVTSTSSNIIKFQGAYSSSTNDENGRSVDAGTVNGRGVIVFGAPGTPLNGNSYSLAGAVNIVCGQSITDTTNTINLNDITALKISGKASFGQLGFSVRFIQELIDGKPGILIGEPGNSKAYIIPLNPASLCTLGQSLDLSTLNGLNGFAITSTIPNFGFSVAHGYDLLGLGKSAIAIAAPPEGISNPGGVFIIPLGASLFTQGSISIDQLRAAGKATLIKGIYKLGWPPIGIHKNKVLLGSQCSIEGKIVTVNEGDTDIDASQADGDKVITVPGLGYDGGAACPMVSMVAGDPVGDGSVAVMKGAPFSHDFSGHINVYYPTTLGSVGSSSSSAGSSSSSSSTGTSGGIGLSSSSSSSSSTGLSSTGLHSSSSSSSTGISAGSTGIIGGIPPTTNASQNNPSLGFAAVAAISSVGGIGSILLMAIFLLLWNRSRSKKKFKKYVAEQDDSRKEIIRSLADKIFAKFSTTRFGHIPEAQMAKYIEAIKQIAIALEKQGVDLQDAGLIDAVIQQITLATLSQSAATLFSSRRAITPELLTQHYETIANGVAIELGYAEPGAMPAVSVINVNGDREHGNETAEFEIPARSFSTRRSTRTTTGSRKKLLPTEGEQPELKIQPEDFQEGVEEKTEDAQAPASQPEALQTNAEESRNEFNEEDFAEFKEGEAEEHKNITPGENGVVVMLPPTSTEPNEPAGSHRMRM